MNVKNRTVFCHDNLYVMRGMDSESIDLIYLDPPFNKKKTFTAPIGSSAEGASFKDIFYESDIKNEWIYEIAEDYKNIHSFLTGIKDYGNKYNYAYLTYMAMRLLECHRILKNTGSIYLHCDQTMSHYLKILMDCIFKENNFLNEIIFQRTLGHHISVGMDTITENILLYSKNKIKTKINPQYSKLEENEINEKFPLIEKETNRRFTHEKLEQSANKSSKGEVRIINGKKIISDIGWRWSQETFNKRIKKNKYLIFWTSKGKPRYKRYYDEYKGRKVQNLWNDINLIFSNSKEATGYPTQKPINLLERIILYGSNKNDIVLDPFCGCATTCIAAEKLDRQWIGIDISHKAHDLVKERLKNEVVRSDQLWEWEKKVHFTTTPPIRMGKNGRTKKYIYIISNPRHKGKYKVGQATNADARLNAYQTGDPNRSYKLEYKKLTPYYNEIETHIHDKFKANYEWVKADKDKIVKEIEKFKLQNLFS